jgi:hypothetical protein
MAPLRRPPQLALDQPSSCFSAFPTLTRSTLLINRFTTSSVVSTWYHHGTSTLVPVRVSGIENIHPHNSTGALRLISCTCTSSYELPPTQASQHHHANDAVREVCVCHVLLRSLLSQVLLFHRGHVKMCHHVRLRVYALARTSPPSSCSCLRTSYSVNVLFGRPLYCLLVCLCTCPC